MNSWNTQSSIGILLLLSLLGLSLATVTVVNRRQTRLRLIGQRVNALRQQIDLLEEIRNAVGPLLETVSVPAFLNQEILRLIDSVALLAPETDMLEAQRAQARQLTEQFAKMQRAAPLNRILNSDAAMAKHRFYLNQAARELRRMRAAERLHPGELDQALTELGWAVLMVDVASLIGQGHKTAELRGILVAEPFYRQAHNLLLQSNSRDERRFRLVRELSELMALQRTALSPELLPEAKTAS